MSERYQRLLKHDEPLYLKDSPVIIDAYALLKDTVTDEIKGQIKFLSVSKKRIKALTVRIVPKDTANKKIDEPFEFEYLDLSEDRDHYFGNKQAINMPNKSTREFDARVIRVVFTDNTEWNNNGLSEWTTVKRPVPLRSLLNRDLCEQFNLEYNKEPWSMNLYSESDNLWYCSCGTVNLTDETICHRCKESKDKLASYNFDEFLSKLEASRKTKEEKDAIEAEEYRKKRAQESEIERQKQEKEKAEKNEKIKKIKSHIFKIYLPIVVVVLTVVLTLNLGILPYVNYQKGVEAMDKHDYVAAMEYLAKAKNQRDSIELMQNMCSDRETKTLCIDVGAASNCLIELESDGSVLSDYPTSYDLDKFKNIKEIDLTDEILLGLTKDGRVVSSVKYNFMINEHNKFLGNLPWDNLKQVKSAGHPDKDYVIVGVKNDGTVLTYYSSSTLYLCEQVKNWTDISMIDVSDNTIVGLKKDGTVCVAYYDSRKDSNLNNIYRERLQNDTRDWKDIVDIEMASGSIMGLKKNGTVISSDYRNDLKGINKNKDIIAIASNTESDSFAVLKKDGTFEFYNKSFRLVEKETIKNIKKVSINNKKAVCITEDNKYKLADVYA